MNGLAERLAGVQAVVAERSASPRELRKSRLNADLCS